MSDKKNSQSNISKKTLVEYLIIAFIFLAMALMVVTFIDREFSFKQYNTSTLEYVPAKVLEITSEDLTDTGQFTAGRQTAKLEIKQGKAKGRVVEVDNLITAGHNVILKEGRRVIVIADMPEHTDPYFTVYNHDRSFGTFALIFLFLAVVVLIGGKKGFMSCLGLVFTLCTVVCFLLPNLFEGGNAGVVSVVTIVLSTVVSCFCIGGLSKKTYLNILSTVLGTVTAGIVYFVFMLVIGISGTNVETIDELVQISHYTGLSLTGILFAGILVSSLGAVMDVAVSIGASLSEIKELNPKITPQALFRSGMNIGKDMIGTMTNTLILAFTGGTLSTLIIFLSVGLQFHQLVSSNFLALEIASGISGSMAVVLTVPISAAICAFSGNKKLKNKNKNKN
ncbi:MAG: YibE/F family protein [Ruminococcaceae bacterium]|nr:YibE/F family protein [Oscillospiraceae bacterium]